MDWAKTFCDNTALQTLQVTSEWLRSCRVTCTTMSDRSRTRQSCRQTSMFFSNGVNTSFSSSSSLKAAVHSNNYP